MKQIKFLKNIYMEGKPIWYKDCIYEVVSESYNSQGRLIYKLFCEDFGLRGIDNILENNFYIIINNDSINKTNITNSSTETPVKTEKKRRKSKASKK